MLSKPSEDPRSNSDDQIADMKEETLGARPPREILHLDSPSSEPPLSRIPEGTEIITAKDARMKAPDGGTYLMQDQVSVVVVDNHEFLAECTNVIEGDIGEDLQIEFTFANDETIRFKVSELGGESPLVRSTTEAEKTVWRCRAGDLVSLIAADQIDLESSGSLSNTGSGLLDLTREADDTSLGAELLDEIYSEDTKRSSNPDRDNEDGVENERSSDDSVTIELEPDTTSLGAQYLEPIDGEGANENERTSVTDRRVLVLDRDDESGDLSSDSEDTIESSMTLDLDEPCNDGSGWSLDLSSTGTGSGLLDLTREADDTSLGAELLDEIYGEDSVLDFEVDDDQEERSSRERVEVGRNERPSFIDRIRSWFS